MNTFTILRDAMDAAAPPLITVGGRPAYGVHEDSLATRVLNAVQKVADTLTAPDGARYVVAFANITTAATSIAERRIIVSSKPLTDPGLTDLDRALHIVALLAHEIGHTHITPRRKAAVIAHLKANPGLPEAPWMSLANIADDLCLEPWMVEQFPVFEGVFEATGEWLMGGRRRDCDATTARDINERFNILLNATRHAPGHPLINIANPETMALFAVWRAWKARLLDLPVTDVVGYIALLEEAWSILKVRPPLPEPEPEPEPVDDDEPEDEPEPPQPTDEPTDDEPEPDDEPGPTTDGGEEPGEDEDGDEPGPSSPPPLDEPEDEDGDEPDGDEPGPDGGDEPTDEPPTSGPDGPTTDEGPTTSGPDNEDGDEWDGSQDDSDVDGDEDPNTDTFSSDSLNNDLHEEASEGEPNWRDGQLQEQVDKDRSTEQFTFGRHGSIPVVWE